MRQLVEKRLDRRAGDHLQGRRGFGRRLSDATAGADRVRLRHRSGHHRHLGRCHLLHGKSGACGQGTMGDLHRLYRCSAHDAEWRRASRSRPCQRQPLLPSNRTLRPSRAKDMQKIDATDFARVQHGEKLILGTLNNGQDVIAEVGRLPGGSHARLSFTRWNSPLSTRGLPHSTAPIATCLGRAHPGPPNKPGSDCAVGLRPAWRRGRRTVSSVA